jgi:hypothetical protein
MYTWSGWFELEHYKSVSSHGAASLTSRRAPASPCSRFVGLFHQVMTAGKEASIPDSNCQSESIFTVHSNPLEGTRQYSLFRKTQLLSLFQGVASRSERNSMFINVLAGNPVEDLKTFRAPAFTT